ncbi:MAG: hypothetical protein IT382_11040, partial [Deltaproteobacteria bacterium]|nr:hypothetical protein [Deltaproteobacteria bacterium]
MSVAPLLAGLAAALVHASAPAPTPGLKATPAPPPASAPAAPSSKYSGHGADSVPAEVLARYRAPELPGEVS